MHGTSLGGGSDDMERRTGTDDEDGMGGGRGEDGGVEMVDA